MGFIWVVCVVIFVVISIGATIDVRKRNKLQQQTKYNFKSVKGNYTFYYSIKGFRSKEGIKVKIITDSIIGLSDVAHFQTNRFVGMDIFIDNSEVDKSLQVKGYKAMAEIIIPSTCIKDNSINVNFTIKAHWCFSKKVIDDVLTFQYEETL